MNMLYYLGFLVLGVNRFANKCMNAYYVKDVKKKMFFCDKSVRFSRRVIFEHCENISIEKNTYINGGMIFAGRNSRIIIGHDCLISYNVHIRTTSHAYSNSNILIREQGGTEKDIRIGNNVWIGYGVQIMAGVTIGDNSIIGAGSVVTKNIPANEIWAGVPAKIIRKR